MSTVKEAESIPNDGLCKCDCGQATPIAKKTRTKLGHKKGYPIPYINGHNRRKSTRYIIEDRGYRTPCWIWQLGKTIWGYGTDQSRAAHRLAFKQHYGYLPSGPLDHKCRQRDCVNPEHLEPVTSAVNTQRGKLAKLTPYGVLTIRLLDNFTTLTRVEMAEVLGVDPGTIFAVLRGQIWKNY